MSRIATTRLFDSLDELADFVVSDPAGQARRESDTFCGGSLKHAVELTRNGDISLVAASEEMLTKFEHLVVPTMRREWQNDIAGFVPNVPSFIAGHPASMRRRKRAENETAPVTIFVDLYASAAYSHGDIVARGVAVLALTRILSAYRPVELYAALASTARSGRTGCVAARVCSTPLDLAHASYALIGVSFLRRMMVVALEATNPSDPFPPLSGSLKALAQEMLPFGQNFIAVPGVVSSVTRDPQGWIIERIREVAPEIVGEEREYV